MLTPEAQHALMQAGAVWATAKAFGVDEFLKTIIKRPGEDISEILAHYTTGPLKNFLNVGKRAKEMSADAAVVQQCVPSRTLGPIIQGASNEDDPDMQELWAALLANAATAGADIPPLYAQFLSAMSPTMAKVLEQVYSLTIAREWNDPERFDNEPGSLTFSRRDIERPIRLSGTERDLQVKASPALSELIALGLIEVVAQQTKLRFPMTSPGTYDPNPPVSVEPSGPAQYRFSVVGRAFMRAVQPPAKLAEPA